MKVIGILTIAPNGHVTLEKPRCIYKSEMREALKADLREIQQELSDMGQSEQEWSPADKARWADLEAEETRLETALRGLR